MPNGCACSGWTTTSENHGERSWAVAHGKEQPRCISGRFEAPDAVIIVACHVPTSKIVVTREYRVALRITIRLPAGLLEAARP